jgi:hypothetical protein
MRIYTLVDEERPCSRSNTVHPSADLNTYLWMWVLRGCVWAQVEEGFLAEHNAHRTEVGRPALTWDPELAQVSSVLHICICMQIKRNKARNDETVLLDFKVAQVSMHLFFSCIYVYIYIYTYCSLRKQGPLPWARSVSSHPVGSALRTWHIPLPQPCSMVDMQRSRGLRRNSHMNSVSLHMSKHTYTCVFVCVCVCVL